MQIPLSQTAQFNVYYDLYLYLIYLPCYFLDRLTILLTGSTALSQLWGEAMTPTTTLAASGRNGYLNASLIVIAPLVVPVIIQTHKT